MFKPFFLLTSLALAAVALPAQMTAAPAVAQVPADLPTGERWLKHFREDLLPFWNVPDAWGTPRGDFPTFRGNDGRAVDWAKPSAELAEAPGWIKENFGREFVRMKSRQTYFYGVAYHLTGDPKMLALAGRFTDGTVTWNTGVRRGSRGDCSSRTMRANGYSWCSSVARTFASTPPSSVLKLCAGSIFVRIGTGLTR